MRIQRFSGALLIALVFHTIVVFFIGIRLANQELQQFQNVLSSIEVVSVPDAPKPQPHQKVKSQSAPSMRFYSKPVEPIIVPTSTLNSSVNSNALGTVMRANQVPATALALDSSASPLAKAVRPMTSPNNTGRIVARSNALGQGKFRGIQTATAFNRQQSNPPNGAVFDDVFYKNHGTNPFIDTEDDNFSTFGMDVDTASYSVMRRYLRDSLLPPTDAVRVEEFVNAFDYNYTPPTEDTFAVHIEGAPSKFGEGKRLQLLHIGIQGRVIADANRKDAILTFVIDVSGSMARENRLGLVKKALSLLLEQLRPGDKVGIVVYGSDARVVLPHTGIENREYIIQAINKLHPDGSTNAAAGLRVGYKLALKNSKSDCINRVILCSDGVANVGQTGPDAILKEIRTYVQEGVTLTTVGFGMGNYNDILMERLANKGNGSYAYVDTLQEAKRIFVENLTGTLQVIAKDAKIQVEFNPDTVSRFRLLGYENRALAHEDFRKDDVDAGEIGAGHSVTALYEIKLHENAEGKLATVFIRHEEPDTQQIIEVNETISTAQLKETFEAASAEFRLATAVAEFAEILRDSFWAKEGSLAIVQETIESVLPHLHVKTPQHKQRKEELLNLLREAHRLKTRKDG